MAQFINRNWGHLTHLDSYRKPLMIRNSDGTEYVGDTHGGPRVMLLRCECGQEFEVKESEFPGRRKLKSCMRPECPFTHPKPKTKREPGRHGVAVCVYLASDTFDYVSKLGVEKGFNFSKILNELIREHMLRKLLDD
jgi:hypothetical protein